MSSSLLVLVPQGSEYRAVVRGLRDGGLSQVRPIAVPIGGTALRTCLKELQRAQSVFTPDLPVLLLGLCGSLSPALAVGDVAICRECRMLHDESNGLAQAGDRSLTDTLGQILHAPDLIGLTSDRVIWSAAEKRQLGHTHRADLVDMEGYAFLEVMQELGARGAIVRVTSDDSEHDLPDLNRAIAPDGRLQPGRLALEMATHPVAALRLIRGSLRGLSRLQQVTATLVTGLMSRGF